MAVLELTPQVLDTEAGLLLPEDILTTSSTYDYGLGFPAYNEGSRIRRPDVDKNPGDTFRWTLDSSLTDLEREFGRGNYIVVVGNDGSNDNTAEIAENEFGLLVINHKDGKNHGRGRTLQNIFSHLAEVAEVGAYTDADNSYLHEDRMRQYRLVAQSSADVVGAKRPPRKAEHSGFVRYYGHTIMQDICNSIAEAPGISDPQAGLQTFSKEAMKQWQFVKDSGWPANREVVRHTARNRKADGSPFIITELEAHAEARDDSSVKIFSASAHMIGSSISMRFNDSPTVIKYKEQMDKYRNVTPGLKAAADVLGTVALNTFLKHQ